MSATQTTSMPPIEDGYVLIHIRSGFKSSDVSGRYTAEALEEAQQRWKLEMMTRVPADTTSTTMNLFRDAPTDVSRAYADEAEANRGKTR